MRSSAWTRLRRVAGPRLGGFLGDRDNAAMAAASLAGFAIRAAGVVLMTVVTVLFTRLMGPAEYGRLAFLLSGSFIVVLFVGLGLPTASSRLVPRYLARGHEAAAAHYVAFGLVAVGTAAALGGAAFAGLIGAFPAAFSDYQFPPAGVVGLVVTIALMRFVSEASRPLGFNLTGFVAESIAVRGILLAALLLYLATGATLAAGAALAIYVGAQGVVVLGVLVLMLRRIPPVAAALRRRRTRLYRAWLGISLVMLVTPVYYFLLFETDIVALGILSGPYEVGLYQVARRLAELTVFCAAAASSVGLPRLARAHAERRADRLQATIDIMNLVNVGSTGAIAVGLVAVGTFALRLFGPDFAAGLPMLLVLAFGRLAMVLLGPVSDLLLMTGHHRRLGRVNLAFAVLNLVLNLVLIPPLGAVGAAIATSTAALSWNAWLYLLARRLTPVDTCVLRHLWHKRRAAAA